MTLFDADQFTAPAAREAEAHMRVFTQVTTADLVDPVWITKSAAEGLVARETYGWTLEHETTGTDVIERLTDHSEILSSAHYRRSGKTDVMARMGGTLIDINFTPSSRIWLGVSAKDLADAKAIVDRILELFPEQKKKDGGDPTVPLSVWTSADHEPTRRMTQASTWEDISYNYAAATRQQLELLMDPEFKAGKGGRLFLLTGAPGTGKSSFITTLGHAWQKFAGLNLIADPQTFLSEPSYFVQVALNRRPDEDWKLLVIEDSGGLFAWDARQQTGEDRLGRLLNLSDGMLGNTSKSLILVTSNEPISSFHSAVSRPGRCAAAITFLPLSETEAKEWLERHERTDLADGVTGERTLAELYALLEGNHVEIAPKRHVGFRAVES